jgi:hypothetical protein
MADRIFLLSAVYKETRMRRRQLIERTGALIVLAVLFVPFGCGGAGNATDSHSSPRVIERSPAEGGEEADRETVARSHCPAGVPDCRTAEGRITFVERVDPDGDGDAHFVILDSQGITLPGLTAIDVRKDLRPNPLPGVGDLISAAGPVQTGSYGQEQIHAVELHVAGR